MTGILEFQKTLGKRPLATVNLIVGEEEFLVKNFIERLKEIYPVTVLWADEVSLQDFESRVATGGMFSKEEVLVVYNSADFFKNIKDHRRLATILQKARNKKVFFYLNAKPDKKELQKEPLQTISSLGEVITAGRPDSRRIREIIKNKLQKGGVSIEEQALDYLIEATSNDLMTLKMETDKLLLYGKEKLSLKDIMTLVPVQLEMGVFDFVNGVLMKDMEKALSSLNWALRMGTHPLQVLTLLVNQTLKLYTALLLLRQGRTVEEALSLVDVKHPLQVRNFKAYMERNSEAELDSLLKRLFYLDLSIKVFYRDPAQSLMSFVIEYMLNEENSDVPSDQGDQDRAQYQP